MDTARNSEIAFPVFRAGGNPELKPSNADSLSVGLRFEPKGPSRLRLAANYWRIAMDETIVIPSGLHMLATEDLFPERVIRAAPSPSDLAAGIPGPLQAIDITRLNNGAIRTSGVDVSASMEIDTRAGRFKPELSGTWVHDFTTSNLAEGPNVDRVGVLHPLGTIPRWRAVATLSWNRAGIGFTGAAQYVPSYDDVDLLGSRNGRNVDSQTIVDIQLSLDLGYIAGERSLWKGFEVRAGAFNLFNAQAPFAEGGGPVGYDATQSDLRGRFAYLKLAKRF